ncbi:hypothetical protein CSOJ01_15010 [Colletotrichum sojae]|uniref:Steroid 5-alpha reductase C-terminal domain-containing protein n=1 Tax=Colletotrichum sojae TaxID=2175907 RepID=A0A8H6MJG0_9PEZI|nr:hypothetical protein CSOJ01_15010 [Colletotrichum sojae]
MTLLQSLLHLTNFKSPLLRTLVPSISAAYAIQLAFAVPSILAQNEQFYDFSGSLTFLSVTALSLCLPSVRTRYSPASTNASASLPSRLVSFAGPGALNWRQIALSGAVVLWAVRLGSYLFKRIVQDGKDSRFDEIKKSPVRFGVAFFAQATWVSLCLLPIVTLNSVPSTVFAALSPIKVSDTLGLLIYLGGFAFEITADWQKSQWLRERRDKIHDEQFMTRGLWSISIVGLLSGVAMSYVSPAFVSLLLLKVSGVPLSEKKYDERYGNRKDYQEWKRNTPKLFPKLM